MKVKFSLLVTLFICSMTINAQSQEDKVKSVDEFIAGGKTIVIAKVLSVEPVMRSGTIRMKVQILHVLKGKEKLGETTVSTNFISLDEGAIYLLRTENAEKEDYNYFRIKSRGSIIELSPYEDIDELKKLPLKTAVERIIYGRKSNLERQIKQLSDELKRLEQMTKEH